MKRLLNFLRANWSAAGGYKEILVLAFPLILSTGAASVQFFVDRMFLAWYSTEAVAASMPAGIFNFACLSIFIGTASYTSTFIAQYFGAGRYERIGAVMWQGNYIALAGGLLHLLLIPLAIPFFKAVGHAPIVAAYETSYFQVLCLGAVPVIASASLSGFFAGKGNPWPVMWVSIGQTAIHLFLDFLLIFGRWGLPELGIRGAGIANVISNFGAFFCYLLLVGRKKYNRKFGTLRYWRFEPALFLRLNRFGLPSGIQMFIDVIGFTFFILLVGRTGTIPLAATNIAFNINTLAFMPMIGIGIAVSVLVGQNLGRNNPALAEKSVYSSFHLTICYMSAIAVLYVAIPGFFITPFTARLHPADFAQVRHIGIILLRFVAFYSVFDTMNIVFLAALRGAGDTRYIMFALSILSVFVLVLPSYIALVMLHGSIYTAWTIVTVYVCALGFMFLFRFLQGKWKHMRVIETIPVV